MDTPPQRKAFAEAAAQAARRLVLADWCALLARTAVRVFAAAIVLWAVLRRCGIQDRAWWALTLIPAWLALNALVAWMRRPEPFAALAAWDRATGRREMFASAWFFENAEARTAGADLHLVRAHVRLGEDRGKLARALPLRFSAAMWIAPLLFAVFAVSGWLRLPISAENLAISPEARARAAKAGAELAKQAAVLKPLGLSDEEKKRLEQLRAALDETAKKLGLMETPRDLLEELERRAREAEKIAEQLRAEDPGALSSAFLAELERNADTAELGAALRAQDLGRVAEEARALQAKLGEQGSLEEQKRLEEELKRALEAANEADRKNKAGEKLDEAGKQLAAGNRAGAAQELGELADDAERAAQRQQAQNQLRDLAQNFRAAGGQILGGQNLQRLMAPAPSGMIPLAGFAQSAPGTPLQQGAPLALIPFSGDPPPGAPDGMLLFPVPGDEPLDPDAPLFLIPGEGGNGDAAIAFPVPGGGGGALGDGKFAGSQAGHGTAPLGGDGTKPRDATQTGMVAPTPGAEGPSQTRAVAGQSHREQAARSKKQIAIEFLKAEEAALAEEPLPLSRRAQVLLYFTALRKQLENQP